MVCKFVRETKTLCLECKRITIAAEREKDRTGKWPSPPPLEGICEAKAKREAA